MDYAADLSVLLSYWKLQDGAQDGRFFHCRAAMLGKWFYRRAYQRATERLPGLDKLFAKQLRYLQKLETSNCASLDRTADAFAQLLCACAGERAEAAERRSLGQVLYHVGRYLYLVDALEDLPKDIKKGNYNPLRYRYELQNGSLTEEDKAQLMDTINVSISMAASAFELLPPRADQEIVTNIIYYGLPAVLNSVAKGTFRKRSKE